MTERTHNERSFIIDLRNSSLRKHLKTRPKALVTSCGLPQPMDLLSCHGYGLVFIMTTKQQPLWYSNKMWFKASEIPNKLDVEVKSCVRKPQHVIFVTFLHINPMSDLSLAKSIHKKLFC